MVLNTQMVEQVVQVGEQEVVLQAHNQAEQEILPQSVHLKEILAVLQMAVVVRVAVAEQVP
tara:strand:- start:225 stop:407 length:183 start_codon:yes stop_codon:yes gene_type:complete